MTDEPTPQPGERPEASSTADAEGRDAQIAAALAVPPLDETTRRRLVRTAIAAADELPAGGATPRSFRRVGAAVGVAAALLVGAVVGAVVVTRPNDPETPTAARAPSTQPTSAAEGAPAPQSAGDAASGEAVGAPPQELGDLGTAEGDDGLRRAIDAAFRKGAAERSAASVAAVSCRAGDPSVLGLVLVSAAGTADLDGRTVTVLVGTTPTGEEQAVVLDPAEGCAITRRLAL